MAEAERSNAERILTMFGMETRFSFVSTAGFAFLLDGEHREATAADFPGSARVSRVGDDVSLSQTFLKIVSARRRNQHARRVRYPEHTPRSPELGRDTLACALRGTYLSVIET